MNGDGFQTRQPPELSLRVSYGSQMPQAKVAPLDTVHLSFPRSAESTALERSPLLPVGAQLRGSSLDQARFS